MKLPLSSLALVSAISAVVSGQSPARPLDPVTAVVDAFRDHDIVALGEGSHNNEQGMAFRMALVRDPRFTAVVNDIVVESGTSMHQDVMDRFIRGESVPEASLRRAWQDTTQPDPVWDVPMYEAFFRAVRDTNVALPRDRQVRVLLGDPPFDWDRSPTREQWLQVDRDGFAATLIQREVLAKHRKALVVYGDEHLGRGLTARNIVARLEAAEPKPGVVNIWTHAQGPDLAEQEPSIKEWPVPSLTFIAGTSLGDVPFSFFRRGIGSGIRLKDRFDAILYLGPVSGIVIRRGEIARSLCDDAAYIRMRLSRMDLIDPPDRPLPPGVVRPADALRRYCEGRRE